MNGITYGVDTPRGHEKVFGKQSMVGVFREGALLALYPTEAQAWAHFDGEKSVFNIAHQVEEHGFRFRIIRMEVAIAGGIPLRGLPSRSFE